MFLLSPFLFMSGIKHWSIQVTVFWCKFLGSSTFRWPQCWPFCDLDLTFLAKKTTPFPWCFKNLRRNWVSVFCRCLSEVNRMSYILFRILRQFAVMWYVENWPKVRNSWEPVPPASGSYTRIIFEIHLSQSLGWMRSSMNGVIQTSHENIVVGILIDISVWGSCSKCVLLPVWPWKEIERKPFILVLQCVFFCIC